MKSGARLVLMLPQIGEEERSIVGNGYYHLAALFSSGIPIPPSFSVTGEAFRYAADFSEFFKDVKKTANSGALNRRRLEKCVNDMNLPPVLENQIAEAYKRISGFSESYAMIIPYIFAKDYVQPLVEERRLIVLGVDAVVSGVRRAWKNLLVESVSQLNELAKGDLSFGVMVEKMPLEEASGIFYTTDAATNDPDKMVIEAVYGLWDIVEKEGFVPDQYIYSKSKKKFVDKYISEQNTMDIRQLNKYEGSGIESLEVSKRWRTIQKLDDKYAKQLTAIGKEIEDYFGEPYEAGWVYEGGKLWVVWMDKIEKLVLSDPAIASVPLKEPGIKLAVEKKLEGSDENKQKDEEVGVKTEKKLKTQAESKLELMEKTSETIQEKKEWVNLPNEAEVSIRGTGNLCGHAEGNVVKRLKSSDLASGKILVSGRIPSADDIDPGRIEAIVIDDDVKNAPNFAIAKMKGIPIVDATAIASKQLVQGEKVWVDSEKGLVYTIKKKAEKTSKGKQKYEIKSKLGPESNQCKEMELISKLKYDRTAAKVILMHTTGGKMSEGYRKYIREVVDEVVVGGKALSRGNRKHSLDLVAVLNSSDKRALILSDNEDQLKTASKWVYRLRTKHGMLKTSMILPSFKDRRQIAEYKKIIQTEKLRRSYTFNVFASITMPANLFDGKGIAAIGVDGFWVDIEKLQKGLRGSESVNVTEQTVKGVEGFLQDIGKDGVPVFCSIGEMQIPKKFVKRLVEAGVDGFCVSNAEKVVTMKNQLGSVEKDRILGG